ncbi:unnamed protein product [Rotaria sordida]|uniref:Phosphatidylethanolamine-binding protein n=1 Tax=Rotaria sordida TaxID=392033 RepID=A0A819Q1P3_9BILA|nr:unnamed protein product [Rotaria sordida]CAF4021694.1 unnamed protein product [Rotaria sordida]
MSEEISSDVAYLLNLSEKFQNNSNELQIKYENDFVNPGSRLTKEQAKEEPFIQINILPEQNTFRTLVMIDPDAPSPSQPITGPFIHWIKANFQDNHLNNGENICPYMGPGPREATGEHRYIFLLYQSNQIIKQDKQFNSIPERRKFTLEKFVSDNHLTLIHLTYFTVYA